ncbi:MAG: hypothetical protein ABIQ16_09025 [Polyangiaceae bacterium]
MKLLVAAVLSLLAGVLLGAIPFVNRYLHLNYFVVIPISGLVLGASFGFLQYRAARLLHARISAVGGLLLTVVGALSYNATDVGIWATTTVQLEEGRTVALREVATLGEFMSERLSHSSVSTRGRTVEMGSTATLISFFVDELGALLGAAAIVFGMSFDASYCRRCSRYRKDSAEELHAYPFDQAEGETRWRALQQLGQSGQYAELQAQVRALPAPAGYPRMLKAEPSTCPKCKQVSLLVSLHHQDAKGEWVSDGDQLRTEAPLEGTSTVG